MSANLFGVLGMLLLSCYGVVGFGVGCSRLSLTNYSCPGQTGWTFQSGFVRPCSLVTCCDCRTKLRTRWQHTWWYDLEVIGWFALLLLML